MSSCSSGLFSQTLATINLPPASMDLPFWIFHILKPFSKEQRAESWVLVPLRVSSCVGLSIIFCLPLLRFPHLKNGHRVFHKRVVVGIKGSSRQCTECRVCPWKPGCVLAAVAMGISCSDGVVQDSRGHGRAKPGTADVFSTGHGSCVSPGQVTYLLPVCTCSFLLL